MDARNPYLDRSGPRPAALTTRGLLAGLLLAASFPVALWSLTEPAVGALLLAAGATLAVRHR